MELDTATTPYAATLVRVAFALAGAAWVYRGNGRVFGYENGGWKYTVYLTLLTSCQTLLEDRFYPRSPSKSFTYLS